MAIILTTPVGRIVQGELWKPLEQKDQKGQVKLGGDGKPQVDYFFALAIPKEPGHTHFAQTAWGRQIWDEGHRAHPNFAPHPTFSWKIEDGDSVIPNKKGKKNCDREGFPGNWILKLRSGFPIPTYNANGTAPLPGEAFETGHFAQARISVKGNTGDTPGVYLNPDMVALSGYGEKIVNTPDASEAGFGAAPLPAGASPAPLAASLPMPAAAPGAPLPMPAAAPGTPLPMPAAAPAAPAPFTPPAPLAVPPNPAFLSGPGGVPAAMAPPPPPPAPMAPAAIAYQMTAKANGYTRDQLIALNWTDAQLRSEGMML